MKLYIPIHNQGSVKTPLNLLLRCYVLLIDHLIVKLTTKSNLYCFHFLNLNINFMLNNAYLTLYADLIY